MTEDEINQYLAKAAKIKQNQENSREYYFNQFKTIIIETSFDLENETDLLELREELLTNLCINRFITADQFAALIKMFHQACSFQRPLIAINLLRQLIQQILETSTSWSHEPIPDVNKRLQALESCVGGFNQAAYQPIKIDLDQALPEDTLLQKEFYDQLANQAKHIGIVETTTDGEHCYESYADAVKDLLWNYCIQLAQPQFILKYFIANYNVSNTDNIYYRSFIQRLAKLHQQEVKLIHNQQAITILEFIDTKHGLHPALEQLLNDQQGDHLGLIKKIQEDVIQELKFLISAAAIQSRLASASRLPLADVSIIVSNEKIKRPN